MTGSKIPSDSSSQKPTSPASPPTKSGLSHLIEYGPLVLFGLAYWKTDIIIASAVFAASAVIACAIAYAAKAPIPKMTLYGALAAALFGGLTFVFDSSVFIKIKPTLAYLTFAAVVALFQVQGKQPIRQVMGGSFELPDFAWATLAWRTTAFFAAMAILNEIVWRTMSETTWVSVKLFGFVPLTILFAVAHAPYLVRHQIKSDDT